MYQITFTVMNDRDPSSNRFTLSETTMISTLPDPVDIREQSQNTMERYKEAWPFRGMDHGGLVVDVSLVPLVLLP